MDPLGLYRKFSENPIFLSLLTHHKLWAEYGIAAVLAEEHSLLRELGARGGVNLGRRMVQRHIIHRKVAQTAAKLRLDARQKTGREGDL